MASDLTRTDSGRMYKMKYCTKVLPVSNIKLPDSLLITDPVLVVGPLDVTWPLVEGEELAGVRE